MHSTEEHTPRTSPLRVIALAGALALLTAGCGVLSDNSADDVEADDPAEESAEESTEEDGGGGDTVELPVSTTVSANDDEELEVEVRALERIGDGVLRLTVGIGNNSTDNIRNLHSMQDRDHADGVLSGVRLLDTEAHKDHLAFTTSDHETCYCGGLDDGIDAGAMEEAWVTFPEPTEGAETMTVLTPVSPPFHGIPVTDGEDHDHPDLADPLTLDLVERTEELAGGSGDDDDDADEGADNGADDGGTSGGLERNETDDEISYDISSDVLFATDSANLNDDAEETLEAVADDIDDAGIETVRIDGHTDNTGNDEVNDPLSEDRAAAVEDLLTELVDGGGVDYEAEGHGSADPVADNDSEDGREQNRRVTITLEK